VRIVFPQGLPAGKKKMVDRCFRVNGGEASCLIDRGRRGSDILIV
jgi:hypothetical protein